MTKTIRLVKPFAGYPVGEYVLEGDCYRRQSPDVSYCIIHKDIVLGMKDYFEEVKEMKEGVKGGIREKYAKHFYYLNLDGDFSMSSGGWSDINDRMYEFGNYYTTPDGAQAVADLRRHVYKFPMIIAEEGGYVLNIAQRLRFRIIDTFGVNQYNPCCFSKYSTEEDRAERLKLIEDCIKHNGYLTI